ncbi:MAG: histidine kinase [Croceibacterium sp.]
MIALTRMVLATIFLLALLIDPTRPARSEIASYGVLVAYMVLAVLLLVLSWRSWWWDYRLAWPVMLIDIAAFLAAVVISEGRASDFTSPFLAFFAFLMLAATIRWDWRVTVLTGVAVTGCYLLIGLYIAGVDAEFDVYRFGRRVVYMLVLTLVLVWFGLQRREQAIERFVDLPGDPGDTGHLLEQGLRFAVAEANAQRAAIAWADYDEPNVSVRTYGFEIQAQSLGPEEFDADRGFLRNAQLYNIARDRALVARRDARPFSRPGQIDNGFATFCEVNEGVALPLIGVTGRGMLLLAEIEGLSVDHIGLGTLLAREITTAFDRQAALTLANAAALARVRDSLARDLHDTVAQSLAGTSLRLEGLRTWIRKGGDPEQEIQAIKQSLRDEQRRVRSLIARLRLGNRGDELVTLAPAIRPVLNSLSLQWRVSTRLDQPDAAIAVPASHVHEIVQVLREAVANAVRHGQAGEIVLSVGRAASELQLTIIDDGSGFPSGDAGPGPWSISERIDKLNGKLDIATSPAGTKLEIAIPIGETP